MTKRTIIIGLDGANWDLLNSIKDSVPTILSLKNKSSWGVMRSSYPPVTQPAWKCYSTGKNPGKLGVYWHEQIDIKNKTISIVNSSMYKSAEYWDYLNKYNISCGIINMPSTYPPRPINKFIVSGGPDARDQRFYNSPTHFANPSEIQEVLLSKFNYQVHPNPILVRNENSEDEVEEILDIIQMRFDVGKYLFENENVDLLQITIFYINILQHFFWNEEPTQRGWKIIDDNIAELINDYGKDIDLILISDHGCRSVDYVFNINNWLINKKYLYINKGFDDYLYKFNLTQELFLRIFKRLGIDELLIKIIPEKFQKFVPPDKGIIKERKIKKVNWEKSVAIASSHGLIYLTDPNEKMLQQIIDELKREFKGEKSKFIKDIHTGRQIYQGEYSTNSPDIIIEFNPGLHINDGIGGPIFEKPIKWRADNIFEGIFLAFGPSILKNHEIKLNITDVAPTILNHFHVPIPDDMDGEVLNIFSNVHEITFQDPIQINQATVEIDDEDVRKRLEALGYIG